MRANQIIFLVTHLQLCFQLALQENQIYNWNYSDFNSSSKQSFTASQNYPYPRLDFVLRNSFNIDFKAPISLDCSEDFWEN